MANSSADRSTFAPTGLCLTEILEKTLTDVSLRKRPVVSLDICAAKDTRSDFVLDYSSPQLMDSMPTHTVLYCNGLLRPRSVVCLRNSSLMSLFTLAPVTAWTNCSVLSSDDTGPIRLTLDTKQPYVQWLPEVNVKWCLLRLGSVKSVSLQLGTPCSTPKTVLAVSDRMHPGNSCHHPEVYPPGQKRQPQAFPPPAPAGMQGAPNGGHGGLKLFPNLWSMLHCRCHCRLPEHSLQHCAVRM